MTDTPHEHRKPNRLGCAFLALMVFPIVYVLSVPFVYLIANFVEEWTGFDTEMAFMLFYTPLRSLYDSYESVHSFFDWYFELFPWLR